VDMRIRAGSEPLNVSRNRGNIVASRTSKAEVESAWVGRDRIDGV